MDYYFSNNSKGLLPSILTALSKVGREEIQGQFKSIEIKETVAQLQVSEKYQMDTIRKIEVFLDQTKTKHKLIIPFPDFQKQFIKFKKS